MIIKNGNTFHLMGRSISYILYINQYGDIAHYYFGSRIADRDYSGYMPRHAKMRHIAPEGEIGLSNIAQEYPAYGHNDLRTPAYTVINSDGNAVSRLKYKSHKIYDGKYAVEGMPSLFEGENHAMTLEITVADEIAGFEAVLYYSVFDEYDVVTRSVKIVNSSEAEIEVTRAMSVNLDLPTGEYETIHFSGSWARERAMKRTLVQEGSTVEMSGASGISGHDVNPFVIVCAPDTDETHGEAYGFSLIYSGDHAAFASKDVFNRLRVQMGINPLNFRWKLAQGESLVAPECVMAYSPCGFEELSHSYHDVYRNNLCKSKWSKLDRPVLINNWEGTYFNFDEEKLLSIAEKAAEAGCELFVLDDGWFGERNDDKRSLGDWYVNTKKLPSGIDGLAEKINSLGMKFGLWFEPEMVNPDSDLYRRRPDWTVHVPNREGAQLRNQLILDLSRDDVCEYVIDSVSKILASANISYVKWDMNRYMTDRPSAGYSHKYTLGFYKVMDAICTAFPDILFEGCASGGGRFDPGVLAYMPQIWTSDNSEAVARLKIQYATSMAYPMSAISAHVTTVPNHQNRRSVSLAMRGAVAMTGSFGYELDITKLSEQEFDEVKEQIKQYKQLRKMLRTGSFYRLQNPFEGEYCAWETVSADGGEAFVMAARSFYTVDTIDRRLKLRGLQSDALYERAETGERFYGSELMNMGVELRYGPHDFSYETVTLKRI